MELYRGAQKVDTPLKTLKKQMSKSFKHFLREIDEGRLPSMDLVSKWCEDADIMVTLLDRGKEHFPPFQSKVRELLESVRQNHLESAHAAAEALNRMRKDCHSRYKG